jgi:hypothetical protein
MYFYKLSVTDKKHVKTYKKSRSQVKIDHIFGFLGYDFLFSINKFHGSKGPVTLATTATKDHRRPQNSRPPETSHTII